MRHLFASATIALAFVVPAAAADSITSISGITVTSINEGSVTSTGTFGRTSISGGRNNFVGVQATGAAATIQIITESGDTAVPAGNSSISNSTITARNGGNVSATGTFNGGSVSGSGNTMGMSAAGTSVNISIVNR